MSIESILSQMRANDVPEPRLPLDTSGRKITFGPGKKAWYRISEWRSPKTGNVYLFGYYGYKSQENWWKIETDFVDLTPEEKARFKRDREEAERLEAERRAAAQQRAANRAKVQLAGASSTGESEYLKRKGVKAVSCRFLSTAGCEGWIIVPLLRYDESPARLVGSQKIDPSGEKHFNKDMDPVGAACRIGADPRDGDLIMLAEGYATALSIYEAVPEHTSFMCCNAGNLLPVARILRKRYPNSPFLFAADDDYLKTKDGRDNFDGIRKATKAAAEVGLSYVALPRFTRDRRQTRDDQSLPELVDFNDLHQAEGIATVRQQLLDAIVHLTAPHSEMAPDSASASPESVPAPAPAEHRGEDTSYHWEAELIRGKSGDLQACQFNIHLIFTHDMPWLGVLVYDEFALRILKRAAPPWPGAVAGFWDDNDTFKAMSWLQKRWSMPVRRSDMVFEAVRAVAKDHGVHPVREYLDGLPPWDGIERLAHLFEDAMGAEEAYRGFAGQAVLVSAVARIVRPGAKVDEMLVLEGNQGLGKSTFVPTLFGADWTLETHENPASKDFYICLEGRWGIEIAELSAFRKSGDWSQVKTAITRINDTYRAPYERSSASHLRQCIFIGTVNEDEWIPDSTGGRRFIPIVARIPIRTDLVLANRDNYWAEALYLYRQGFKWWDYPKELVEPEQSARWIQDAWLGPIIRYLEGKAPSDRYNGLPPAPINETSTEDLLVRAIGCELDKIGQPQTTRVGNIMKVLKWHKRRLSTPGRPYVYMRPKEGVQPA